MGDRNARLAGFLFSKYRVLNPKLYNSIRARYSCSGALEARASGTLEARASRSRRAPAARSRRAPAARVAGGALVLEVCE